MSNRPPTPEPVKRKLRQESSFGCCVCGNPIIIYHHTIPWEIEEHFRVEDMMCLCPNHHDEATKGALIETEQGDYKAMPYNIKRKYANGLLIINHNAPVIKVGTCSYVGEGEFISVDEHCLLETKVKSWHLLLSLKLYNKNGKLKAKIKDNEWVSGNSMPWDIIASYQFLKIWHKERDIGLEINTKNFPINLIAKFIYGRQKIDINNRGIFFNGVIQHSAFININFVGVRHAADTNKKIITLKYDRRFGGALVVGESIEECLKKLEKLKTTSLSSN